MIIWLTGLSGSGKTTVSKILQKLLVKHGKKVITIDGDIIRDLYGNDLKFHLEDRKKQIGRIQQLAKFLNKKNNIIIVAALYSNKKILNQNRKIFKKYLEIYMKVPLKILIKRDIKNLYKKALQKKIKNVVGIDIKWSEPTNSDLIVDQSKKISPILIAKQIFNIITNGKN